MFYENVSFLRHLRRFLFAAAVTIGGLGLAVGGAVGILLALGGFVLTGMLASTILSARRLASLKVVETLREL